MLGTCIVVLALLGTVLSGYTMGGFQDQREVQTFDYVTDVSGLFDITQAPEYVPYNPNSNYIGYSPNGIVQYSPSSKVNNYRYVVSEGQTDVSTASINWEGDYPQGSQFTNNPPGVQTALGIYWTGSGDFPPAHTLISGVYGNAGVGDYDSDGVPNATDMTEIIRYLNLSAYATVEIDISYGEWPVLFYAGDWTKHLIPPDSPQYAVYSATMDDSTAMPTHLTIKPSSMAVSAWRNGVKMWDANGDHVTVIYRYETEDGPQHENITTQQASASLSISATTYPVYGYMDPTKGVSMDYGEPGVQTENFTSSSDYIGLYRFFDRPAITPPGGSTITMSINAGQTFPSPTGHWTYGSGGNKIIMDVRPYDSNFPEAKQYINNLMPFNAGINQERINGSYIQVSTLGTILQGYGAFSRPGYDDMEITVSNNGAYPVLFVPHNRWSPTQVVNSANGQTYSMIVYRGSFFLDDFTPDTFVIHNRNCSAYGTINGSPYLMWSCPVDDIDVINQYRINMGTDATDWAMNNAYTNATLTLTYTSITPYVMAYIDDTGDFNGAWNDSDTVDSNSVNAVLYPWDPSQPKEEWWPYITTMNYILARWGLSPDKEYRIELTHSDYPVFMNPIDSNAWVESGRGDGSDPYVNYYYQSTDIVDRLVYDHGTLIGYKKVGSTYVQLWTTTPDNVWVAWKYATLDSNGVDYAIVNNLAPVNTTASITEVNGDSVGVTWSNGYRNDEITISIQRYNTNWNYLTIQAGASSVGITSNPSGYITIRTDNGDTVQDISLGIWKNIQLTIRAVDGSLVITPLTSLSFTAPSPTNGASQTIDGWYDGGPIESLRFSTGGQSLRWQITSTSVFLDTFNSVMNNPTIDINDYFPDLEDYRLNFYSFAIYGDGMTINNVPMTVNRNNGTVTWTSTVDGAQRTNTRPLQNIYVTKSPVDGVDHTFLTFVNQNATYDLGATVTDTVTFSGLWFFTTGLYDAVLTIEDYYDWNITGGWNITTGQALVIFLGLLIAGAMVCRSLLHFTIKGMDGLVMVIGALFSIIVIGGLA